MQAKDIAKIRIGNIKIGFTNKKITAYAEFSLLAAFFKPHYHPDSPSRPFHIRLLIRPHY
jgi:hypothetical protein